MEQLEQLRSDLTIVFADYNVQVTETALTAYDNRDDECYKMFFIAKEMQGLSDGSLRSYKGVLDQFFKARTKPITEMTTNDIRFFLAMKKRQGASMSYMDIIRRYLKTFFQFLEDEEYIKVNPVKKIQSIKQPKTMRPGMTEDETERLRMACDCPRDLAIVDFFLSTGCRVAELETVNRTRINWDEGSVVVMGKGNKERKVFINPRAKATIKIYLATRDDDNPALFVQRKCPSKRIQKGGIELMIRETGKRAGLEHVHPHKLRRTAATLALNRGMPIDQVKDMLGHDSMETTLIYAKASDESLKNSHRMYMH